MARESGETDKTASNARTRTRGHHTRAAAARHARWGTGTVPYRRAKNMADIVPPPDASGHANQTFLLHCLLFFSASQLAIGLN